MYKLKVIQHADIRQNELEQIIQIKSVAWPYPYEKQLEWINSNLKDSDLHLLLLKNNDAVAYLNLIYIELEIDNLNFNALGVGNVCAKEKGKGYGIELMRQTNHFLTERNRIGLLFCKKEIVDFYKKYDWNLVEKSHLKLTFDKKIIETMIFNYTLLFNQLIFNGRAF